jgi:serine/threonine-protein kinase
VGLSPGSRIAHYEVLAAIGAGGMGEVYRARDTKLGRDVALKILPERFASDSERLARFEREARVLASLNHPHIAGIHGIEEGAGVRALVLELVEGETVDERLRSSSGVPSALPLEDALSIARQVAVALEAAHEQGIVHRDLKPSNIKITPQGTVKVLDFGLAKLAEPAAAAPASSGLRVSQSPTITSPAMMTGIGLILGTAAYMSPEQAKGRPADKKSDIWSYGCVLFEMLTGTRPFDGEDVSETMAAVIRGEADWSRLPAETPAHVRTLLRRSLQKDPRRRLPDIGLVRIELEEERPAAPPPTPPPSPPASRIWTRPLLPAATAVLASAITALSLSQQPEIPKKPIRFEFSRTELPSAGLNSTVVAVSPDGNEIVFAAGTQLVRRSLDDLEPRPIPGTQESGNVQSPAYSSDGSQIAFVSPADKAIKRLPAGGGAAMVVTRLANQPFGLSWDGNDSILFAQATNGGDIMRVSAAGGEPEPLVPVNDGEIAYGPQLLPGGRAVLFTLTRGAFAARWEQAQIVVALLETGERRTVIERGADARYVPSGHLVYASGGILLAVPFDPERLSASPPAVQVVQGVRRSPLAIGSGVAHFAVSANGVLAYLPGPARSVAGASTVLILDESARGTPLNLPPALYETPRVSPDGGQIAVSTADGVVYVYEIATAVPRRLTLDGRNRYPVWSADGTRLVFQSDREGDLGLFWQRADGTGGATRLTRAEPGTAHIPESWPKRGPNVISYSVRDEKTGAASLWVYKWDEQRSAPVADIEGARLLNSAFSPDGRFLAYTFRGNSGASVRVVPFPAVDAIREVSRIDEAGHHPLWSLDGTRLMYSPGANPIAFVEVSTKDGFKVLGNRKPLPGAWTGVATPETPLQHDVFRDGRFVTVAADVNANTPAGGDVRVVLNWFDELRRLMAAAPK